jgi:hypothetical protein
MREFIRAALIAFVAAVSVQSAWSAPQGTIARDADDAVLTPIRDGSRYGDNRRWRGGDHDRARDGVRSGQLLPLEVVLSNVARQYPGHHLNVDGPFARNGRWIYRIKWLTPDGRVMIIFADAETGQVLGQR